MGIITPSEPTPIPVNENEELEFNVDWILAHRKRGKGFQWLALLDVFPTYDAQWQQPIYFTGKDGTRTS